MRTQCHLVLGFVAVMALAGTTAAAPVVSRTAFQEESAVLSFTHIEPLVCDDGSSSTLTTDVFIITRERRESGQRTSEAQAEIIRRNGCTGEFLETYPVISNPDAEVSGVDSATLDVSFELIEFTTGESLGFLDVALVFDGSDATRRIETSTLCFDGITSVRRSRTQSSSANVEGTVSLNGIDLLADVEYSATLSTLDLHVVEEQVAECACSNETTNPELGPDDEEIVAARELLAATVTTRASEVEMAEASFSNAEPITCDDGTSGTLETTVTINASEETASFNSETSIESDANAAAFQFNTCTGEFRVSFAIVPDPDYDQQGTVSATLDESFDLADSSTGALTGELDTMLVFTGSGEATCSSVFAVMHVPPGIFSEGSRLTIESRTRESRPASLSGSALLDGVELVSSGDFGSLVTSSERVLRIEH